MEMIGPTTFAKKGIKSISINTNGSEKVRISDVLSIISEGNKLSPLLIFKGKKGKTSEKKITKNKIYKRKKIICL